MSESSSGPEGHQAEWRPSAADLLTAVRVPLAVAFVLWPAGRLPVLLVSGASDILDGYLARRWGATRLGAFLDPVADKLFAVCAFGVVAASGVLAWYEVIGVLLRDIVAAGAFVSTVAKHRTRVIPARAGGKVVTALQMATLLAFVLESGAVRPLAWLTAAVGIVAIWDYHRVADRAARTLHR